MLKQLIIPILAIATAVAQPPGRHHGGPGGRGGAEALKTYLSLTDAQLTQIREAVKAGHEANKPVAEQMRTKGKALRDAMQAGTTDANAVGKQMIELRDLRKQIQANRAKAGEQAASYLTAEQKTKLAALKESTELRREARAAMALGLLAPPAGEGRGMGKQIPMRGFRGGRH